MPRVRGVIESLELCRVEAPSSRINIHKNGFATDIAHSVGRCHVRERGHQDLVAGPHTESQQRKMESNGSIAYAESCSCAGNSREFPLELVNKRTC